MTAAPNAVSAYRWLIAIVTLVIILILINRWRVGHTIIYYLVLLTLMLMLLTQYQAIAWTLAPFNSLQNPTQKAGGK